jgi:hypothetical protein
MNFDYIFILTYGRSGSTLLQGVLNSIPGVLVRGENNAALRSLTRAWNSLSISNAGFTGDMTSPKHAWFGMSEWDMDGFGQDLAAAFMKNVLRPQPDTRVIGFKEIRYFPPHFQPILELEFIRRFFPRSGFIVNTRNLDDTFESVKVANHSITRLQLEQSDEMLRSLAEASDVHHIHYDDYRENSAAFRPLFDFLGADFDPASVEKVLADRHSVQSRAVEGGKG